MPSTYSTILSAQTTPQSEPLPGRENEMKQNSAGGYTFGITPFQRLERFLILGSDKPTYYASERKLSKENAENVRTCLKEDWRKTIDLIVEVSQTGRAPKNDPALFALAVAATPAFSNPVAAELALKVLPQVARIGTHLYHFMDYLSSMRGTGRAVRRTLADWFTSKSADQLAYQVVKYQQRDGWSAQRLIRWAHANSNDAVKQAVLAWSAVGGLDALKSAAAEWTRSPKKYNLTEDEIVLRRGRYANAVRVLEENAPAVLTAFEAVQKATTAKEVARLIRDGGLTHEMIPTQFKTDPVVWAALLDKMPMTAMIRNLGNMTKIGLLRPLSDATALVTSRLSNAGLIRKARVHPIQILLAQATYAKGKGLRGSGEWTVVQPIVDALDAAFYSAFENVVPTGKRIYLALDVSGSMGMESAVCPLTAAQVSAAMAMVTARTEPNYCIFGFSSKMVDLGISKSMALSEVLRNVSNRTFGATDCAVAFRHAREAKIDADAFVTITDNETWHGEQHAVVALREYRWATGRPDVASVVMGVTATDFSIADPKDPLMLDVVGFDAAAPRLIADFIRGKGESPIDSDGDQV